MRYWVCINTLSILEANISIDIIFVFLVRFFRYSSASVVVTVGENQLNLVSEYKIDYIIQNIYYYTVDGVQQYNATTGLHNIALLQTVLSIDLEGNPLADFLYYGI